MVPGYIDNSVLMDERMDEGRGGKDLLPID